jgi:nitroreductase
MAEVMQFTTLGEILEHLSTRRNIRAYRRDEKPSRHIVRGILNVAARAPFLSHDKEIPWHFIATDDRTLIASMVKSLDPDDEGEPDYAAPESQGFNPVTYFKNAPWVVVMLTKLPDPEKAPQEKRDSISYDMITSYGAALGSLLSAAHLAGLCASWDGAFTATSAKRADGIERLLGVKSPWRVHSIVPIGYPAEKGDKTDIKLDEIVEFR